MLSIEKAHPRQLGGDALLKIKSGFTPLVPKTSALILTQTWTE